MFLIADGSMGVQAWLKPHRWPAPLSLTARHRPITASTQGVPASELVFKRVLMGGFPCFSDGPLRPQWDHILQVRAKAEGRVPGPPACLPQRS